MDTPTINWGAYGGDPLAAAELKTLPLAATQDGHAEVAIGSFLTNESAKGLRATKDADTAIAYIVDRILEPDGVSKKTFGYLTAVEAGLGNHMLALYPIGGLELNMGEDETGGCISDADIAAGKIYYDIVVGAVRDTAVGSVLPMEVAHANIRIDSSSGAASATGKVIQIISVINPEGIGQRASVTNPAWTTGLGRVFLCKVIADAATESQS